MKYEEFLESMKSVATQLTQIHQQIVQMQEPVVEQLILSQSCDKQLIEQTLDRLLDVACCDAGLKLFRRLCRYYWSINPESTASYIHAYREMWDSEHDDKAESDRDNIVSGKALAAGVSAGATQEPAASAVPLTDATRAEPNESVTLFITFTTYGTWLPGDRRGWRKWKAGEQRPQPLLEDWCRDRMKEQPVFLNEHQRQQVETVIREHATIRCWSLHAVSVRSNHVHIAVTASAPPKRVREQFKANATRVLREPPMPIKNEKVWTKGGDIEFVDTEDDLFQVVMYITEAQDRMDCRE